MRANVSEKLREPEMDHSEIQIGLRLKQARRAKGLQLKQLAEGVGCSVSLISKIENEKVRPSLQMLHRIVGQLGLTIGELFTERGEAGDIVAREGSRAIIRMDHQGEKGGVSLECLLPPDGGKFLYGSIHIVDPGSGSQGAINHIGEEVGYLLQGALELTVDDKVYNLNPGDSFFFESSRPHSYRNTGTIQTRVLWVNSPSTF
jgi:transcriptional regulator with XRE-family HTH domain